MGKIRKRASSNGAANITIFGIFALVLIMLLAGFMVDLSKSVYVGNLYRDYARKAAQTAIKDQNLVGGLNGTAANKFIMEYMIQRHPEIDPVGATQEANAMRSKCEVTGNYPVIRIQFDTERRVGASPNSTVLTSYGGNKIPINNANYYDKDYQAIDVEVLDVTDNFFLGMFGKHCQEIKIKTSAIASTAYDQD